MASVLAAVLDDLRAIIAGTSSASPIAVDRYLAVEYRPESLLPIAVTRPYPFEIEIGPRTEPMGYPTDVSGTYAYYGRSLTVRVGYAGDAHEGEDQQDRIVTDEDEIVLALEDPASWSESAWVACTVEGSELLGALIPGSNEMGDDEFAKVLQITFEVIYRETRP